MFAPGRDGVGVHGAGCTGLLHLANLRIDKRGIVGFLACVFERRQRYVGMAKPGEDAGIGAGSTRCPAIAAAAVCGGEQIRAKLCDALLGEGACLGEEVPLLQLLGDLEGVRCLWRATCDPCGFERLDCVGWTPLSRTELG